MRASTFTTYINTKEEPGAYRALDRYTDVSVARYGAIARAANEAARAAAGLLEGRGTAGRGQAQARDLGRIADAERSVAREAAAATRAANSNATAVRNQGRAARAAASDNGILARSLQTTARTLNIVQGPLGPLAGRVSAIASAVEELTGFRLGLAAVGTALFTIGRAGGSYANLESRLKPFFESQEAANRAMEDAIGIAKRARSPLESIVGLYSRLTSVGTEYGLSQARIGRVTELASKAATISGGPATVQRAGLEQFAQAIGNGRLNGDELVSIMTNIPQLADAIAKGFENVDGSIGTSIGSLRKLGEEGKLTTEKIVAAVERSAGSIETKFARIPVTLSTAGTEITTAATVMVGQFDKAIGLTSALAEAIHTVAENLRGAVALAVAFGGVIAGPRIAAAATAIAGGIRNIAETTLVAQRRVKEMDVAWIADLQATRTSAAARVAALNQEQAELRESIALLERRRMVAAGDYARAMPGEGFAGSDRRMKAAVDEERDAVRQLITERRRLQIINNALVDANGVAVQSSERLAAATRNVASRMGLLRSAASSLVGFLGGPWGIALAVASTALYLFATKTDEAAEAVARFAGGQEELDRRLGITTAQLQTASQAARDFAVALAEAAVEEERSKVRRTGAQLDATLGSASWNMGARYGDRQHIRDRTRLSELGRWAGERGSLNPAQIQEVLAIQQRRPEAFKGTWLQSLVGSDPAKAIQVIRGAAAATFALADAEKKLEEVRQAGGSGAPSRRGAITVKNKEQLAADARAFAARTELERARADVATIRAGGKTAGETDDAYVQRLGTAIQRVNDLAKAEKEARSARSAAAVAARKEARDARQDAIDSAGQRRDQSLLKLAMSDVPQGTAEYLNARRAILKTYDEEVNKIDASRAASRSAVAQQISDQESIEKQAAAATEKRSDILGGWRDEPRAVTRAMDQIDDLEKIVGKYIEVNGQLVEYTQTMADADARRITEGLKRPLEDVLRTHEREIEVSRLVLQGRQAEAEALRTAYDLYDQIGKVTQSEYEGLVRNAQEQQRINDILAQRERLLEPINGAVDAARDGFDQLLRDIGRGQPDALKGFFSGLQDQVWSITTRRITESLFAGADEKVRALISGRNSVDTAIHQFNGSLGKAQIATGRFASAVDDAVEWVSEAVNRMAGIATTPRVGDTAQNIVSAAANGGTLTSAFLGALPGVIASVANDNGEIVVKGRGSAQRAPVVSGTLPTAGQVSSTMFGSVGSSLDKVFGTKFFSKMGDVFGGALEGAGKGAFASGVAQILGIKQDGTGASIGGALGSFLPIPGGAFIGGLLGGTLGSLFQKPKYGSAQVSLNQWGEVVGGAASGRGSGEIGAATGAAGSVASGVNQIMETLGADISSIPGITIGNWNGRARVALTSTNRALHSKNFGPDILKDFGEGGEQDAIAFAIKYAIEKGVITGISQASVNILKSGQDLQQALDKALAIESIPKRLMQRTDPVRYAVEQVNAEFDKLISYLKEGGATTEQFADAQKLYEMERADAIKAATEQAAGAIDAFLKDMTGGSSSPLNKRTVYDSASAEIGKLQSDVLAGKLVDQNDLLEAARNFQDASRSLFGSSQSFFSDFEMLRSLLSKARDNAGGLGIDNLPASPFETDSTVQARLAELATGQLSATRQQTDTLSAKLDQVIRTIEDVGVGGGGVTTSSAIDLLPGYGAAA